MTEEEKKAIEDCKELIKDLKNNKDKDFIGRLYYKGKPVEENIEILLNFIEKLQKENGELKENERYMKDVFEEQICTLKVDKERFKRYSIQKEEEIKELKSNSITKDKIREKIKNIKENYSEFSECSIYKSIDFLKELLEEE